MKVIGMIGGMSWESSIEYYRIINETIRDELGGLHSAKSLMYSVEFNEVEKLQQSGRWEQATQIMTDAAIRLRRGGADFIIICTNTMHLMAEEVKKTGGLPLLHIADATGLEIQNQGLQRIALLGTRFTMEKDFYRGRLEALGLQVLTPENEDRKIVHDIIYNELCLGEIKERSRRQYLNIIENLHSKGAQGIILGCTEIGLLIKEADCDIPVFDTTRIHAESAALHSIGRRELGVRSSAKLL